MNKSIETAQQLRIVKAEYDLLNAQLEQKKAQYETLKKQLITDMVGDNVKQLGLAADGEIPGLSISMGIVQSWSPVVENKDKLYDILKEDAPALFSVNSRSLNSYIKDIYDLNSKQLPKKYEGLVKVFEDSHLTFKEK